MQESFLQSLKAPIIQITRFIFESRQRNLMSNDKTNLQEYEDAIILEGGRELEENKKQINKDIEKEGGGEKENESQYDSQNNKQGGKKFGFIEDFSFKNPFTPVNHFVQTDAIDESIREFYYYNFPECLDTFLVYAEIMKDGDFKVKRMTSASRRRSRRPKYKEILVEKSLCLAPTTKGHDMVLKLHQG